VKYFSGAGGLSASVEDYLQFAQMLLNRGELDGHRLLGPRTVEMMTANHTGDMVNGQLARASRTVGAVAAVATVLFVAGVRSDDKEPSELQRRTGEYVKQFTASLANLVGQEDMQIRDRKVNSDILLVRYPGSLTDLLFYRDVRSVNGAERANHAEHLLDMFQKNFDSAVGRANQISSDGAEFVPTVLNPLYAIAFLQPAMPTSTLYSES